MANEPAEAAVAADPAPTSKQPAKAAAPASDPKDAAADRVTAALVESVRNSPISRSHEAWACIVETAVPAVRAAVLKEL